MGRTSTARIEESFTDLVVMLLEGGEENIRIMRTDEQNNDLLGYDVDSFLCSWPSQGRTWQEFKS